jgi:ribonuclease BN (tRNA processing enzyme)
MQLIFLGVNAALTVGPKTFHANMLVQSSSAANLLIDCSGDIRHSLYELGYSHYAIDAVYISHLHADHVGGLEWLGFSKYFIEKKSLPLYISPDQHQPLWENVLSGGMSTLEQEQASLETFFQLKPVNNLSFTWEQSLFQLIKVEHSYNNHLLLPSYGLLIKGPLHTIFISTDMRHNPQLLATAYASADLIFQDCEISHIASGQHARYQELKQLNPEIKQKMWLYGYNDEILPQAQQDGFQGFVIRGQCFNF